MSRFGIPAMVAAALILSAAGTGCSKKTGKTAGQADKSGEHQEHSPKVKENLAKLSDADRASAEKQMTCPVSGEHLGSMGVPKKVTVKGQDVWVCCDSCKETIQKDPDKYLAKLKK